MVSYRPQITMVVSHLLCSSIVLLPTNPLLQWIMPTTKSSSLLAKIIKVFHLTYKHMLISLLVNQKWLIKINQTKSIHTQTVYMSICYINNNSSIPTPNTVRGVYRLVESSQNMVCLCEQIYTDLFNLKYRFGEKV